MGMSALTAYLLGAAALALAAAVCVLVPWAAWKGRHLPLALVALVTGTGFVVFLGLHPFPPPGAVACRPPILDPSNALAPYVRLWRAEAPLAVWLRDPGVVSLPMNVVFFAGVGALLALNTRRWTVACGFAVGLSGFIELSQITGLYGVYPCPYRYFDTTDLLANIGGVVAGFGLLHGRGVRPAGDPDGTRGRRARAP